MPLRFFFKMLLAVMPTRFSKTLSGLLHGMNSGAKELKWNTYGVGCAGTALSEHMPLLFKDPLHSGQKVGQLLPCGQVIMLETGSLEK